MTKRHGALPGCRSGNPAARSRLGLLTAVALATVLVAVFLAPPRVQAVKADGLPGFGDLWARFTGKKTDASLQSTSDATNPDKTVEQTTSLSPGTGVQDTPKKPVDPGVPLQEINNALTEGSDATSELGRTTGEVSQNPGMLEKAGLALNTKFLTDFINHVGSQLSEGTLQTIGQVSGLFQGDNLKKTVTEGLGMVADTAGKVANEVTTGLSSATNQVVEDTAKKTAQAMNSVLDVSKTPRSLLDVQNQATEREHSEASAAVAQQQQLLASITSTLQAMIKTAVRTGMQIEASDWNAISETAGKIATKLGTWQVAIQKCDALIKDHPLRQLADAIRSAPAQFQTFASFAKDIAQKLDSLAKSTPQNAPNSKDALKTVLSAAKVTLDGIKESVESLSTQVKTQLQSPKAHDTTADPNNPLACIASEQPPDLTKDFADFTTVAIQLSSAVDAVMNDQ